MGTNVESLYLDCDTQGLRQVTHACELPSGSLSY